MKVFAMNLILLSSIVYSAPASASAPSLEMGSNGQLTAPPNLNPLQLCNFQTEFAFQFPDFSIQEIGKMACESICFFHNYRRAIKDFLDFIRFKTENSNSKNQQEVLKSIDHWEQFTNNSDPSFTDLYSKILCIKDIFEKKRSK